MSCENQLYWQHTRGSGYNRYTRRLPNGQMAVIETTGKRLSLIIETHHSEYDTLADAICAADQVARYRD